MKIMHDFFVSLLLLMPSISLAQGRWDAASSVGFSPRALLTSCVVDDKIYAIGGYNDTAYLNTLEVFDPGLNSWSTPKTTGTFTARRGLTSAVVDGKIYVMGGYDGKNWLNTLEVFDPSFNAWSTPVTTGIFTAREKLCSSVIDGKIYVMGGYNGVIHLNTLEVFDPSTNMWSTPQTTGTFTARRGLCAAVVNGKIYVTGGFNGGTSYLNILEVFDPLTNSWSTPFTTGTFTERGAFTSAVIANKIYTIGGIHYVDGNFIPVSTVEVFDPFSNSWSMPAITGTFTPRFEITSSVVNSKIYVLGGKDGGYHNTNEVFTQSANAVKTIGNIENIKIFPNPTGGIVTVHGMPINTEHIIVINLLGDKVIDLANSKNSDCTLDLSTLPLGIYYARFTTVNSVTVRKIVKE